MKHFNLRTAYKYYDIGTDYLSGNFQRPFMGTWWNTLKEKGKMEVWLYGKLAWKAVLPTTSTNPEADRLPNFSPSFAMNASNYKNI
jgi:hypothetical protein